jgi:hypothetical protein
MKRTDLRMLVIGALCGVVVMLVMGQGPMTVRADGIQFPDGTVQTSADTRRSFYLTDDDLIEGQNALGACDTGFHMASLWEILDVSNLRYASEQLDAYVASDSGQGPPSGTFGWIRTGGPQDEGSADQGVANCKLWTEFDPYYGTQAQLENRWDGNATPPAVDWLGPWETAAVGCENFGRVWCVQD